jgi:hypothetical protein
MIRRRTVYFEIEKRTDSQLILKTKDFLQKKSYSVHQNILKFALKAHKSVLCTDIFTRL